MIEHIIEINKRGMKLRIQDSLLALKENDTVVKTISFEDINTIILTERASSLSSAVLSECASHKISIVICDAKYKPNALLQPLNNYSVHKIIYSQATAKKSLQKQLWKEIIKQKILNQATILKTLNINDRQISLLVNEVKSGDSTNVEAQAASIFWKKFPLINKRDRMQNDINILFNYSYMVILGCVARAICATGLNPSLGISHHNKYNPFCLASDLIEPYRFIAEIAVISTVNDFKDKLTPSIKNNLLNSIFNTKFMLAKRKVKLIEGIQRSATSLKYSFQTAKTSLILPKMFEVQ